MDKDHLFSIIVPVYNSKLYLENCLRSILEQSYPIIELILINDGSTDNSGIICDSFAAKDNRIKVIHKENGGQGSARNLALKIAKGDYIMFVDSDDAIGPDTLLRNYEILKENPEIDCLQFPIYRNYGTKKEFLHKGNEFLYNKAADFKRLLLDRSIISWIVCDKIIKRKVLKGLYFPEDMVYEDNYFVLDLIDRLDYVYISENGLYYYFHRDDSTTTTKFSLKSELSTFKVLVHVLNKLKLPEENTLFLKYLIRLINVEKSLKVNFNYNLEKVLNYKRKLKLKDIISADISFKDRIKLLTYKMISTGF